MAPGRPSGSFKLDANGFKRLEDEYGKRVMQCLYCETIITSVKKERLESHRYF